MKQCLSAKLTTLLQQVPIVRHLSRQKFIAQFVIDLLKSRNVQFCEVTHHLNDGVKLASNETRIQDFFREADLDYLLLAHLLLTLLPATSKLRLCLDRTEWDFGQCQVNILLITVGQGAFQVPLYGSCSTTAVVIPALPTASPCCKPVCACWASTALVWCWGTANSWAMCG